MKLCNDSIEFKVLVRTQYKGSNAVQVYGKPISSCYKYIIIYIFLWMQVWVCVYVWPRLFRLIFFVLIIFIIIYLFIYSFFAFNNDNNNNNSSTCNTNRSRGVYDLYYLPWCSNGGVPLFIDAYQCLSWGWLFQDDNWLGSKSV